MAQVTRAWPRPSGGIFHFPPHPIFALVALVILASGGVWAFTEGPLHQGQATPTYQTAPVTRGNLAITVSATGPIGLEGSPTNERSRGMSSGRPCPKRPLADWNRAPRRVRSPPAARNWAPMAYSRR